ncbi:MAG: gliding motility-associated protein GldE [Bacteroidales bacterium]|nr:gliding motility-associated protein GldE [Bacteroidales bacterium]
MAASALISGSEVAFFSLGPREKANLESRKGATPRRILKLLEKPEHLLATILIVNNLVNVGIVILSTWVTGAVINFGSHAVLGFLIQTVAITFVILLIGEILPKVYATRYAQRFAYLMALPVTILEVLFRSVTGVMVSSTSLVKKRLKESAGSLSMDELSHALELTGEELKEDEQILKGIVRFGNIDVSEIMQPRVDMVAVEIKTSFSELLDTLMRSGFSRIPVFVEDMDHIKGILFVKDLLPHFHKSGNFRWQSLIRPPYFIPENKKINDLLEEFQQHKIHLAMVVDEYGGTSGLITLEDILEEIVGEISDESDEEEPLFSQIDRHTYLFDAKISVHDFCKILNIPDEVFKEIRGESETLAGVILEIRGELPEIEEKIIFRNFTFVIKNVDDRRIKEILVKIQEVSGNESC